MRRKATATGLGALVALSLDSLVPIKANQS